MAQVLKEELRDRIVDAAKKELLAKGDKNFAEGHDVHLELLGREAEGAAVACLLVMHAEDQLMSAEAFKLVAQELIDVYKEINKK